MQHNTSSVHICVYISYNNINKSCDNCNKIVYFYRVIIYFVFFTLLFTLYYLLVYFVYINSEWQFVLTFIYPYIYYIIILFYIKNLDRYSRDDILMKLPDDVQCWYTPRSVFVDELMLKAAKLLRTNSKKYLNTHMHTQNRIVL